MPASKILVLCKNSARFARVRGACGALGRGILRGVTNRDDAIDIVREGSINLVIIDQAGGLDLRAICSLISVASLGRRPTAVVVLTDYYNVADATTLFRLGVSDYLAYSENQDSLTQTVAALAGLECPSAMELELAARAYPAPRSRQLTAAV